VPKPLHLLVLAQYPPRPPWTKADADAFLPSGVSSTSTSATPWRIDTSAVSGVTDSRSRGTGSALQSLAPAPDDAPGQWGALLEGQPVLHCYALGAEELRKASYLGIEPWHHITMQWGDGDPAGLGLMLDGNPGQDVSGLTPAQYQSQRSGGALRGDTLTLPGLALKSARSKISAPSAPADLEGSSTIELEVPAFAGGGGGLALRHLLPSRGAVTIGDEVIAYEKLNTSGIADWRRGARQDTVRNDPTVAFPRTTDHPAASGAQSGSIVWPSGFRRVLTSGTLLTGNATLAERLPTDTTVRISAATGTPVDTAGRHLVDDGLILTCSGTIPFDEYALLWLSGYTAGGAGIAQAVPVRRLPGTSQLEVQRVLPRRQNVGSSITIPPAFTAFYLDLSVDHDLAGVPLNGGANPANDPLATGRFLAAGGTSTLHALQILEPTNGGCEWIAYNSLLEVGHPNGTGGSVSRVYAVMSGSPLIWRGQQRTAIQSFPTSSRVLPVQTVVADGRGLLTGDVVSFVPPIGASLSVPAFQAVVRYTPVDTGTVALSTDTFQSWFALTERVPELGTAPGLAANGYHLIHGSGIGPGWDLSPTSATLPAMVWQRGAPPRVDRWLRGVSGKALLALMPDSEGEVDGLWAASPVGPTDVSGHGVVRSVSSASLATAPLTAVGTELTFNRPLVPSADYRLAQVAGETLVLGPGSSSSSAVVIAKPVLATGAWAGVPVAPPAAVLGGGIAQDQLATVRLLPLGPVARMVNQNGGTSGDAIVFHAEDPTGGIAQQVSLAATVGSVTTAAVAPWVGTPLLVVPQVPASGSPTAGPEVLMLPSADRRGQFLTAPWLRGMYDTTKTDWQATDEPIVIRWWPRYPSLLPPTPRPEAYRSRQFPWFSLPWHLRRLKLTGVAAGNEVDAADAVTEVRVMAGARADGAVQAGVFAFVGGSGPGDWSVVSKTSFPSPNQIERSSPSGWTWGPAITEIDGVEARLTWHYKGTGIGISADTMSDLAQRGGTPVHSHGLRLYGTAPIVVLGTETGP
jgi:hypothetical protein